jgi:dipeptidyl aminopeptidase/acylaminoacyl peptidase
MIPLPKVPFEADKVGSAVAKGQTPSVMNLTPYPHGIASCPIISSTHAAWLEMAEDGYDCDHNRIILYELSSGRHFSISKDWDRSPESIIFSADGRTIIGTVGDDAVVKVFTISLPSTEDIAAERAEQLTPTFITHTYGASSPHPLPNGKILFLQSSTTHPNELYIVNSDGSNNRRLSDFSHTLLEGKKYRLEPGEKFYFPGSGGTRVQGWVYKPSGVKEGQKAAWPAMMYVPPSNDGAAFLTGFDI